MNECYIGSQVLSQDAELNYDSFEMKFVRESPEFCFGANYQMTKERFLEICATQGEVDWNKYHMALTSLQCTCVNNVLCGITDNPRVIQYNVPSTGYVYHKIVSILNTCEFGTTFKIPKKDIVQLFAEHNIVNWKLIEAALISRGCACTCENEIIGITFRKPLMHKTIARIKKRDALLALCSSIIQQRKTRKRTKVYCSSTSSRTGL